VCIGTGLGPLWISAPFALADDHVHLLTDEPVSGSLAVIGDVGVVVAQLRTVTNAGTSSWCVSAGLINGSDDPRPYDLLAFGLLGPTGEIGRATIPLVPDRDRLPGSGQLAPRASTAGTVCFDPLPTTSGRFAVVYDPAGQGGGRAMFYFER
jgi:hypothetical protein